MLSTGEAYGLRLVCEVNQLSLAYWENIRGDRPMPSRADLRPEDMVPFLSNVILLDVAADPLDFRYLLMGTNVAFRIADKDYTGLSMSQIPHQTPPSEIFEICRQVVETRRPVGQRAPYVGRYADFKNIEDIHMPLSQDGRHVNMIFVTVDFVESAEQMAGANHGPERE